MALMEEMPMPHNGSIGGPGAGVDGECDPFLWCDTDGGRSFGGDKMSSFWEEWFFHRPSERLPLCNC